MNCGLFLKRAPKYREGLWSEEKFTILFPNLHHKMAEKVAHQTSLKTTNSWSTSLSTLLLLSPVTLEVSPLSHLTGLLLSAWSFLCRFHWAENPYVLYSNYSSIYKSKRRLWRLCWNGHRINETNSVTESLWTSLKGRKEIPTHFCRWTN